MQTIILIVLILYSSYLTLEKYVVTGRIFGARRKLSDHLPEQIDAQPVEPMPQDLIGRSRFGIGQSVTNGDISRQHALIGDNIDIFTPQTQPLLPRVSSEQPIPQSNFSKAEQHLSPVSENGFVSSQDIDRKNIDADHLFGEQKKNEHSEVFVEEMGLDSETTTGRRAQGITFGDMEALHHVLDGDQQVSPQMQAVVRETFRRLEGTNVERLLRASILGSSEKLQRYMDLYLTAPAVPTSKQKTKESILGLFDIEEFV